jgi:hypothetical protein
MVPLLDWFGRSFFSWAWHWIAHFHPLPGIFIMAHQINYNNLSIHQGPHIARVTLAAFECNSLDFPEPPYPDEFAKYAHAY